MKMNMVDGYVKIISINKETKEEIKEEKECKIISFFPWSDGVHTFPVGVIMLKTGELSQYPVTSLRFKLNIDKPIVSTKLQ